MNHDYESDPDLPHGETGTLAQPSAETMSLGGDAASSRMSSFVARFSAGRQGFLVGCALALCCITLAAIAFAGKGSETLADQRVPAQPEQPIEIPTPSRSGAIGQLPGGNVWIGYHDVMLALPRSWAHSDSMSCGTTIEPTSTPPRAPQSKCSAMSGGQRSMVLWLRQEATVADLRDRGFVQTSIDGHPVFSAPIEKSGPAYLQYVGLPDTDTLVVLRAPEQGTIERLVQSLRSIPATWVSVPDLRGQDPQQALNTLAGLDLVGLADHNSGMAMPSETVVVNQNPASGQVVGHHAVVTIAVLPSHRAD